MTDVSNLHLLEHVHAPGKIGVCQSYRTHAARTRLPRRASSVGRPPPSEKTVEVSRLSTMSPCDAPSCVTVAERRCSSPAAARWRRPGRARGAPKGPRRARPARCRAPRRRARPGAERRRRASRSEVTVARRPRLSPRRATLRELASGCAPRPPGAAFGDRRVGEPAGFVPERACRRRLQLPALLSPGEPRSAAVRRRSTEAKNAREFHPPWR